MKRLKRAAITIELLTAIDVLPLITLDYGFDDVKPTTLVSIEAVKEKIRETMRELDAKGRL